MSQYGYRHAGFVIEHGPIQAASMTDAKAIIRKKLGVKRLPWGLQVWDLATRPLAVYRVVQ